MAIELVQQPIPPHKLLQPISSRVTKVIKSLRLIPATHSRTKSRSFRSICITKVAEQNSELDGDNKDKRTLTQIKTELLQAVQGINRGTFGVPSAKKSEIEALVELLESQNPTIDPTLNLDKVGGNWKLVYSTITILGSKRTKLGLRDFITLGDFFQSIDVAKGKAVNVIKFNVRGLNLLKGQLTIEASFKNASKSVKASRVNIAYENSRITPEQLMNMFRKNYDLLLEIFNPEGWLEISYVDNTMRIGRDDKGNIFVLERPSAAENMA